jgi:hypothetical protein
MCVRGNTPWDWTEFYTKVRWKRVLELYQMQQEREKASGSGAEAVNLQEVAIMNVLSRLIRAFTGED